MKRLLALTLILAALLSLSACSLIPAPRKSMEDITADDLAAAAERLTEMDSDEIGAAVDAAFGGSAAAVPEETKLEPIENYLVTIEITPENFWDYFELVVLPSYDQWGEATGYYFFGLKSKLYDQGLIYYPDATDSDFLMEIEWHHSQTYKNNANKWSLRDLLKMEYGSAFSRKDDDKVEFRVLRSKGTLTFVRQEYIERIEDSSTTKVRGYTYHYCTIYLKNGDRISNYYYEGMRY